MQQRRYRNLKIASLIEHELSLFIAKEIEVPDALITVTDVAVSDELDNTKITLSVIPYAKELEAFTAIETRRKEIEYKILKKSRLRVIPKFTFIIDSHKEE